MRWYGKNRSPDRAGRRRKLEPLGRLAHGARIYFSIDSDQQPDGRWVAQVPEFPDIVAFAGSEEEALAKAELRALNALAEQRWRLLRSA
jgi:hypothetical protein